MITYGGRVLNTRAPENIKGGSPEQITHAPQILQTSQVPVESITPKYIGGDDDFKDKLFDTLKESSKELYSVVRNASVTGTPLGQMLGGFAWPCSWAWWIITNIWNLIVYFLIFCFVMIIVNVIQMGLNLVHGAIGGVLTPLKAVYGIKIAGSRLFGFLGGPVRSLQKTQDSIAKTVVELFIKIIKKLLE